MKFASYKTGTRLSAGFGIVLLLTFILGLGCYQIAAKLSRYTEQFYRHPFAVSNAVKDIHTRLAAMHRSMKDVVLASSELQSMEAINKVNEHEKKVLDSFKLVSERYLGNQDDVQKAYQAFVDWKPIRTEVIELALADRKIEGAEITKKKGADHVQKLENLVDRLETFALQKAESFYSETQTTQRQAARTIWFSLAIIIGIGGLVSVLITRSITTPLRQMVASIRVVASGDLDITTLPLSRNDEIGELASSLDQLTTTLRQTAKQAQTIASGDYDADINPRSAKDELGVAMQVMTRSLRDISRENEINNWQKNGQVQLGDLLRGELPVSEVAEIIVRFITEYLGGQVGAFYLGTDDDTFTLLASYAYKYRKDLSNSFTRGEGLVGQAALEKKLLVVSKVPHDHLKISSGLGESTPLNILVAPFISNNAVRAVLEIASVEEFTDVQLQFLEDFSERLAIFITSAMSRELLQEMLEKTQQQAEELESQQEELRVTNEELKEQTSELECSKAELQTQQEELRVTNEELEEKTYSLEKSKADIEERNRALSESRRIVEKKAEDLALASRYKSEFLANMSHELRTPLNSLLLLARSLANNQTGNLTPDQVEAAEIIQNGGKELLNLINGILDLSKIEAGKIEINVEETSLHSIVTNLRSQFQHLARDKGLEFSVHIAQGVPETITTDQHRLEQILKNLLSNAIKFTREGRVTVDIEFPARTAGFDCLMDPSQGISIAVTDTGIGIKPENQNLIFHAFQQEDGSTAREYGGTGLGLSISTELARLLGGEIELQSTPQVGSTFILYLPLHMEAKPKGTDSFLKAKAPLNTGKNSDSAIQMFYHPESDAESASVVFSFADDRDSIQEGDRIIVIIEDEENFARILFRECHNKNFKCLVAPSGEEGIALIDRYEPAAVILDIKLAGRMNGWDVLDQLKKNARLRHIPVHMMSVEEATIDAMKKGAIAFLNKPISTENLNEAFARIEHILNREISNLLVVEDNDVLRKEIITLIGNGDVKSQEAVNGQEAFAAIREKRFDCVVLDLGLPDMSGFDLLDKLEDSGAEIPPVVIYTGRELSREEDERLHRYTDSIIIKGVKSEERLLDETALFLHRIVEKLPEQKRQMIASLHEQDQMFAGKKILLVDDDMRNTFALAKILKEKNLEIKIASDGRQALEILDEGDDLDLVIMDIMMPVMDGYEAMRRIRKQDRFWDLPIIALTAKAMKEDKDDCIKAGASDYLSKPVDVERLLSMLRVWLYR